MQSLFIVDAIGPFFRNVKTRDTINWSKIPFDDIEQNGFWEQKNQDELKCDFKYFIRKVKELGYTHITLDDIAHLVIYDFYPEDLKNKLQKYRGLYKELIKMAKEEDLRVLMTSDVFYTNKHIRRQTGGGFKRTLYLIQEACEQVLRDFDVEGMVFRIGEADGEGVSSDFRSQIKIKTSRQARNFLQVLIPLFEQLNKLLIFRTWTLGAYEVGDLMWNPKTYDKVFQGIDSSCLIISFKPGESDFYPELPLNNLFMRDKKQKIIEFQARQEHKGFGRFPLYAGWEYERYYKQLQECENLVGLAVWVQQNGGWSKDYSVTFIENSLVWNELNVAAAVSVFQGGCASDLILKKFNSQEYVDFLKKCEEIYLQVSCTFRLDNDPLYFRRLRVPPYVWILWDNIILTPAMRALHATFVKDYQDVPKEVFDSLLKQGENLRVKETRFFVDTMCFFQTCQQYLLKRISGEALKKELDQYQEKYPGIYRFIFKDKENIWAAKIVANLLVRRQPGYRWRDQVLATRSVAWLLRQILRVQKKQVPKLDKTHIGIEGILR